MKFLQIKLTFLFLFKECILCHAVCNHHYPLYFFAQCYTVLRPLLSEYLENGQIRNRSAIDSLCIEVWVKSISLLLHLSSLEMFLASVVWEEGGETGARGERSLMFNKTWIYNTEVWICPMHEKKLGP